ncbi:MAG: hypothetical protein IK121_08900 [Lachnospiraceae bacterium]|nr:hypothetical protein [Lachnospiraceae bacterium]
MDYSLKNENAVKTEQIKADLKRQQERLKEYAEHYKCIRILANGGNKR